MRCCRRPPIPDHRIIHTDWTVFHTIDPTSSVSSALRFVCQYCSDGDYYQFCRSCLKINSIDGIVLVVNFTFYSPAPDIFAWGAYFWGMPHGDKANTSNERCVEITHRWGRLEQKEKLNIGKVTQQRKDIKVTEATSCAPPEVHIRQESW